MILLSGDFLCFVVFFYNFLHPINSRMRQLLVVADFGLFASEQNDRADQDGRENTADQHTGL